MATFVIRGPLAPADVPGLGARLCAELDRSDARVVVCDLHEVAADAVAVDALGRLALAAHRHGRRVLLRGATPALRELVAFVGLDGVLTL